jgi:predicted phosphatase
MMGKPIGDVWIDDRAMHFEDNWKEIMDQLNAKK